MQNRGFLWGALAGAAAILLVLLVIGLSLVHAGGYNVAATAGHTAFGGWLLDTTMHSSVQRRAAGVVPPDPARIDIAAGASEYKAMCQQCHGGPGIDRDDWADGLSPRPPDLARAAGDWRPEEIFWIVKHGVKMSGMPSFGQTHDDATVWNIAAFVKALPAMTPDRYRAFEVGHGHGDGETAHSHAG